MKTTSLLVYVLRTFSYSGTSRRHGPHHEAQIFITTTFPWKSASRKFLSSKALICRSHVLSGRNIRFVSGAGAVVLISGSGVSGGCTGAGGVAEAGVVMRLPDCGATLKAERAARMKGRGSLLITSRKNNRFVWVWAGWIGLQSAHTHPRTRQLQFRACSLRDLLLCSTQKGLKRIS